MSSSFLRKEVFSDYQITEVNLKGKASPPVSAEVTSTQDIEAFNLTEDKVLTFFSLVLEAFPPKEGLLVSLNRSTFPESDGIVH